MFNMSQKTLIIASLLSLVIASAASYGIHRRFLAQSDDGMGWNNHTCEEVFPGLEKCPSTMSGCPECCAMRGGVPTQIQPGISISMDPGVTLKSCMGAEGTDGEPCGGEMGCGFGTCHSNRVETLCMPGGNYDPETGMDSGETCEDTPTDFSCTITQDSCPPNYPCNMGTCCEDVPYCLSPTDGPDCSQVCDDPRTQEFCGMGDP